jgi:hypothetical protein
MEPLSFHSDLSDSRNTLNRGPIGALGFLAAGSSTAIGDGALGNSAWAFARWRLTGDLVSVVMPGRLLIDTQIASMGSLSLGALHSSPLLAGPAIAPDSRLAPYSHVAPWATYSGFNRMAKLVNGTPMPRVPHDAPPVTQGVSTPVAVTAIYSIASGGIFSSGRIAKDSIHTSCPASPAHCDSLNAISP